MSDRYAQAVAERAKRVRQAKIDAALPLVSVTIVASGAIGIALGLLLEVVRNHVA